MDSGGLDELLRRARQRDAEALEELVETYSRRVYGLLYRLTGSREAAEDLMQETFLRVVRVIDQYEHVGKFEPWLFRIAANLARDRARRRGRAPGIGSISDGVSADDTELSKTGAGWLGDPAGQMLRKEGVERLEYGLDQLSDAHREIILLRHFSDLSFREIAQMLDIPLGTALARAHRALARLRELISKEE